MSTAPVLEAPKGWNAYATGRHIDMAPPQLSADHAANTATVSGFVDRLADESGSDLLAWLQLYDTVPEKVAYQALGEVKPATESGGAPEWRSVERAALAPRQGTGNKWRTRFDALGRLAAAAPASPASPEAANMDWLGRVTLGRLHQHLGDCLLRELSGNSYATVEAHLRDAETWFAGVEGEQDLKAMVNIIRGRAQAWRNGARGATAVLSISLARFREQNNRLREAEAAYELGIANLDSNYPDAADKLFSVSVEANRQRKQQPEALARALQSRGRARIEHALQTSDGEVRNRILAAAQQDALEAFDLSEPSPAARKIESELVQLGKRDSSGSAERSHEPFRAAMAARDLAAIELVRFDSGPTQMPRSLDPARQWFRIACKQQGYGQVFDEGGRGGLRQELDTATGDQFTLLRLLQLELDILRRGARNDSLEVLIEVAKRFLARNEVNYAIECLKSAADGYQARSQTEQDDDRAAADYWRYRAARLASMVGHRFTESNVPAVQSLELAKAFGETVSRIEATVMQLVSQGPDRLTAEVMIAGRHAGCILHVFDARIAKSIDFVRLQRLSDRGDCPRIMEWRADEGQWGYVLTEQVSGRPLRDLLQLGPLPDSAEAELRIRTAARLCRAMAALLFAHVPRSRLAQPLFVTPDDVLLLPGGRCVVARFGQLHGLKQPSIGWGYIFDDLTNDGVWPIRADAVATARIVCLLLGVSDVKAGNLRASTFLRRVSWFLRKSRGLELVSQKAVEALDRLLKAKPPSGDKSEAETAETDSRSAPKQGYADLMRLADHLDRSVGTLKAGRTPS